MRSVRRAGGLLALFAAVVGCSGKYTGTKRYPLSGKVAYGGQPVDQGTISFLPAGEGQRVSGGPITDGAYAVPEELGANAGTYRVEVRWHKKTGKMYKDRDSGEMYDVRKEGLPDKYHAKSELTAEVSAGRTTFDFDLPKAD
jgi:hypothetical protein